MTNEPAFILAWDLAFLHPDDEFTATLIRFPGYEMVVGWMDTIPVPVPDPVYMVANLETLRKVDYPDNNVGWPIMSERMRTMLLDAQALPHRVIRVAMLDDTVPAKQRFDPSGAPRAGAPVIEGFAAVQFTEHLDAFDWDRSEYVRHDRLPGEVKKLTKLVLRDVPLPKLFRLSAIPDYMFVSAAGRRELEAAGIKGAAFRPISQARR